MPSTQPDRLTPLQRIDALLNGVEIDRTPCHPFIGDHAATVLGITVSSYHKSAKLMAAAQVAAWRQYGHDWVGIALMAAVREFGRRPLPPAEIGRGQ